mgnify:FL=1
MSSIVLDPTGELEPSFRQPLAKPNSLEGLTLGLLDISKAKGNVFLDRLETLFSEKGVAVRRYKKPTFARPAPTELLQDISTNVDVVIEGLAD